MGAHTVYKYKIIQVRAPHVPPDTVPVSPLSEPEGAAQPWATACGAGGAEAARSGSASA
ncbi:hypothetical protein GCM10009551_015060 [Nocardiopsis tropica]